MELTRLDVDPSGHTAEKWNWHGEFDGGSVDQEFYRGVNDGCCDANDLVTLISVETGREVLHYSRTPLEDMSEPAEIEIPNSGLHRYVGFTEAYQLPPRDSALRGKLLGVIEYGDGRPLPRRWALYSNDVDACCRFQSLHVARTDSGGPGSRYIQIWRDVVDVRRQSIGGVDLVLNFPTYDDASGDPPEDIVRVPIMNDDLDLQHIRGPHGWTVPRSNET